GGAGQRGGIIGSSTSRGKDALLSRAKGTRGHTFGDDLGSGPAGASAGTCPAALPTRRLDRARATRRILARDLGACPRHSLPRPTIFSPWPRGSAEGPSAGREPATRALDLRLAASRLGPAP